jgi:hypothetical protein
MKKILLLFLLAPALTFGQTYNLFFGVDTIQSLQLAGPTLSIVPGNSVDLSPFLDNTDSQNLSISNDTLSISGGNSVVLPSSGGSVTIDTFDVVSNTARLSLTGDNVPFLSIDLSSYLDNTDSQNLSLVTNTLSISGGNSVDLSSYLDNTDSQTLSISNDTLSISGGNSVVLPASGGGGTYQYAHARFVGTISASLASDSLTVTTLDTIGTTSDFVITADGAIKYVGSGGTIKFRVDLSLSFFTKPNISFQLAKNGTPIPNCSFIAFPIQSSNASDNKGQFGFTWVEINASTNDEFEVFVTSDAGFPQNISECCFFAEVK